MKRTIFLIVALSFAATIYPQDIPKINYENPRVKRPLGLSFNLGGPTFIASASVDYFVLPGLNIEAGGGIWGYYVGPKYHFKGNTRKNITLYTGILLTVFPPLPLLEMPSGGNMGWHFKQPQTQYFSYIPIGLNSISDNGYTTSIEVAVVPFWFSLKFGYHFISRNGKKANK